MNNYTVKRVHSYETVSNQVTSFLLSVSAVATMYLLPNVPFFGDRVLVQLMASYTFLYVFFTAYLTLSIALTLMVFDNSEDPEPNNNNNLAVFGFVFYLASTSIITLLFLALKLLFAYNNFLLGYTQSLFFFLFIFLSYFLFVLFTKSYLVNNLVDKLIF